MSALNLTPSLPAGPGYCLPMPHRPDTGGATREDTRCEPTASLSHCRTVSVCTIGRDSRTPGPRRTSEGLRRFYWSLIPRERSRQRDADLATRGYSVSLSLPPVAAPLRDSFQSHSSAVSCRGWAEVYSSGSIRSSSERDPELLAASLRWGQSCGIMVVLSQVRLSLPSTAPKGE